MDFEAELRDFINFMHELHDDKELHEGGFGGSGGMFVCQKFLKVLGFHRGFLLSYLVDQWAVQTKYGETAKFNPQAPEGQQVPRKYYVDLERLGLIKIDSNYNLTINAEHIVKMAAGKLRLKKKGV